jgi:gliding motility-associated-like protein
MLVKIMMKFIVITCIACAPFFVQAQVSCNTLGQNPSSAFPVCGTDTFSQATVPQCGGKQIINSGCNDFLSDINPFWYRFTCFQSGTLGFKITPLKLSDDYDWQLFDITGKNPDNVYTDATMFVACNWSGETGITGASPAGTSLTVCGTVPGGPFRPLFSAMPSLIAGHEYLLLVSQFTQTSTSGYSLVFNDGSAIITDFKDPALQAARAICDGQQMTVKLNKKMRCNSLNADGSDFAISPAIAPIVAATGVNCSNGFDMDSVVLTLGAPLPPGNYTITVKNDANNQNLLDNCKRTIPLGQMLSVTVFPLISTPMDSISPVACKPTVLELVFNKPMRCNSVAGDGTDFTVVGPMGSIAVANAKGRNCSNEGLSQIIEVTLATPIQQAGTYRITLQNGSDGNTLINECGMPTAAGSFLTFAGYDTVNARFNYSIKLGCKEDSIYFSHNGNNGVNNWRWTFDEGKKSFAKDTLLTYRIFNNKTAQLVVSNGVCSDSSELITIPLTNTLKAVLTSPDVVCPGDAVSFTEASFNDVRTWTWSFGNGSSSSSQGPQPQTYLPDIRDRTATVSLIVTNNIGCSDTALKSIRILNNCYIAVPKAFTPNGDGRNEFLYPTNAWKARDLYFAVYNRGGQLLFETRNWQVKWDGRYKGNPQDPGTYVWILQYTHIDTGERFNLKGSTILLR